MTKAKHKRKNLLGLTVPEGESMTIMMGNKAVGRQDTGATTESFRLVHK